MKKEKKSKKSRNFIKLSLISVLSVVCCFGVILMASASSYSFYLQLNQGGTAWSTTRSFNGRKYVYVNTSSFDKVNGLDYTKLQIDLYSVSNGNQSYVERVKGEIYDSLIGVNVIYPFDNRDSGDFRYKFTTNVDNYRYGGLKANVTTVAGN